MKNLIIIFTLFNILNIKAQSIEKTLFNVVDVFIEKEIIAKKRDRDSVVLNIVFFKAKKDYVINLRVFPLVIKHLKNIDTIYTYKGIKSVVDLERISSNAKKQILKDFDIFEKDNIKISELQENEEIYGRINYDPYISILLQFNKHNKLYIIASGRSDKEYYQLLKGKVKFAKKVQFTPSPTPRRM